MAEIVIIVDTDGVTGDYSSLVLAEAGEQTNLVTDGDNIVFNCQATTGVADTTRVLFDGWTTGGSNDIKIEGTDFPTDGVLDTSKYILALTLYGEIFECFEEFLTIKNIQIQNNHATNSVGILNYVASTAASLFVVDSCIVDNCVEIGVRINNDINFIIKNTIIRNNSNGYGIRHSKYVSALVGEWFMYNNTITGCNIGISTYSQSNDIAVNNLVFNNTDDFDGSFDVLDHNASDDGDGTNAVTITQTASDYAALVTDAPGGDFSVTDADSELYNAGTNTGAPSDDIIGTSRPQATTVDIGAFEFIADGSPSVVISGILTGSYGLLTMKKSYHRAIGGTL